MDTPSGMASARVTVGVTRHPKHLTNGRLAAVVLALALLTSGGWPAVAQDESGESDDQPAIIAPLAPRSLMLDAARAGDALVVVGERGHILVSRDRGSSWRQCEVPTRSMLTAVTFHDAELGWAVGHDSVILRTEDGGTTWTKVYWAPEDEAPFFDVWFADASNGIAIGAYGSFYRTGDGGATWDFEPLEDADWHLHEIVRADDGTFYMAAEAGVIYRSDDDGTTWMELPSPYEGSFFGVLPLGGETVLVFGLRGHLFRSEDRGNTWTAVDTGTVAMLTSGAKLADGTVLVVGLGGTVLTSTDDGRSFSLAQQPARRGISSVIEFEDGTLLLAGEFGVKITTVAELTAAAE